MVSATTAVGRRGAAYLYISLGLSTLTPVLHQTFHQLPPMRAILLLCVFVAALVSFPAPVSSSDADPPRAKPSHVYGRRDYAPQVNARNSSPPPKKRQDHPRPSPKPPTWKRDGEDDRPSRPKPSAWYVKRADDDPPRAKPSAVHRDYLLRRSAAEKEQVRSLEEQNVVVSDGAKGGPAWYLEDRCPAPLSACPVRGAPDADAYECVDLLSDLDSCGGCAADDISFDCNSIPHARGVECVSGFCEVRSCMEGYVVVPTRDMCVRQ